ncbi:hypothetical protein LXM94_20780 [Rhizobium sp. TRM95111]|uniref:hypothetical protein n=1 Tax=Rhizobium alarense TaxID=2846851 RepID=UPI001F295C3A|nr:hypothetical protein [Rhizobium alarense]MCF3642411.1 hypothetical protein [Rhizobium alarense]
MFSRTSLIARAAAAACLAALSAAAPSADAGTRDKAFFERVAGTWQGPGEIVAGKYKGTKFNCTLAGDPLAASETGITLDGQCRVGVFTQPMSATITRSGAGYKGKFLDGANGKGLDVTGGKVSDGKMVVSITRQRLNGALVARLQNDRTMNITISVKVADQMVPVIGMSLNRKVDAVAVGSID